MTSNTNLVNGILSNWPSVLPLVQPLVNSGAQAADHLLPSPWNKVAKIAANSLIKVAGPGAAILNNCFKPSKEIFHYQRKNKTYATLGCVHFVLASLSFACDCIKYNLSNAPTDDPNEFLSTDTFEACSLFLIGISAAVLAAREFMYKASLENENTKRKMLGEKLSTALMAVDEPLLKATSKRALKYSLARVLPRTVAKIVSKVKKLNLIEPKAAETTQIAVKFAELLIATPESILELAVCYATDEVTQEILKETFNLVTSQYPPGNSQIFIINNMINGNHPKTTLEAWLGIPPSRWIQLLRRLGSVLAMLAISPEEGLVRLFASKRIPSDKINALREMAMATVIFAAALKAIDVKKLEAAISVLPMRSRAENMLRLVVEIKGRTINPLAVVPSLTSLINAVKGALKEENMQPFYETSTPLL